MPKADDLFSSSLTEEYISGEIFQNLDQVIEEDLQPLIRELAKACAYEKCFSISGEFLSLMNFYIESSGTDLEDYPGQLKSKHDAFISAHRNLFFKNAAIPLICAWVAESWDLVVATLMDKAEEQKDSMTFDFLQSLHDDMTASFARAYRRIMRDYDKGE